MSSYSDRELEAMMTDLESDLVERKRSGADRSGIRRNVCAFANDLPGHGRPGVILIGVHNDGSCAPITIDDPLLSTRAQMSRDGTNEALAYNGLVQSWPEITRLAREGLEPSTEQAALFAEAGDG